MIVLVTLLACQLAWVSAQQSLNLSKKQLAIQLRPFVAVLGSPFDPSFSFRYDEKRQGYWLIVRHRAQNLGEQPAHAYMRKNDKVMMVSLPSELLDAVARTTSDPNRSLAERDAAIQQMLDARKEIIEQLYVYLLKYPMATWQEIREQFGDKGVHCYGDIVEHFSSPTVLLPKQSQEEPSPRDAGSAYGQELASGKAALVYYVYLTYEGALLGETFSTFYMGYYDEHRSRCFKGSVDPVGVDRVPLVEYRQWMDRQSL